MKRLLKHTDKKLDPNGREIIGEVTVSMDLIIDPEIVASTGDDFFPGRTQFLHDVESIITDHLGCTVGYSEESNRDEEDSISIYLVIYVPVDKQHSVMCTAFVMFTDPATAEIYTKDYAVFIQKMAAKFKHVTSHRMRDAFIAVPPSIYRDYHASLQDVENQFRDLISSWEREYRKRGRI